MAKTTNINLNLTEDENTSFVDWRKSIDGNNDSENKSNMQIIDEKIGDHETRITALENAGGGGGVEVLVVEQINNQLTLTAEQVNKILAKPFNYVLKYVHPQMSIYLYLPLNHINGNEYIFGNTIANNVASLTDLKFCYLVFSLTADTKSIAKAQGYKSFSVS